MGRKGQTNQSTKIVFKRLCCTCTIKVTRAVTRAPWPRPAALRGGSPSTDGLPEPTSTQLQWLRHGADEAKASGPLTLFFQIPGNNFIFAIFILFLNESPCPHPPPQSSKTSSLANSGSVSVRDRGLSQNANFR